jgi:ArsR family transcriptional regulator, arsenate/arsenite/antimonite-responsive transcriptional repressor / arsenate reductase (thioredoxin)
MHTESQLTSPEFIKSLAHDIRWQLLKVLSHGDYRVHELVDHIDQPFNLVSYHLKKLLQSDVVRYRRSDADRRDLYYSLDLEKLRAQFYLAMVTIHPAISNFPWSGAKPDNNVKRASVLFLCTGNSARSQMAEAILRDLSKGAVAAYSAGNHPEPVHPLAIETLSKRGIDISQQVPKHLDSFINDNFDEVITVCDRIRENCPTLPGCKQVTHWSIADPAGISDKATQIRAFVTIADELTTRITFFLTQLRC